MAYTIEITGNGPVHSDDAHDADQLARGLVSSLQAAGHSLSAATITYVPTQPAKVEEDLLQPPTP